MTDALVLTTPLLDQYFRLKEEAKDSLLLFRVGDFYEAYGEDAKSLSQTLEIILTGREVRGARIPMAGVPHHTLDNHLKTLLKYGHKVAICEQLEEASDVKKLIHRDIVRYLTPGTILESEFLDEKEPNHLLAIWPQTARNRNLTEGGTYGLSWCDASTGTWMTALVSEEHLSREISKIAPKEIVLPEGMALPVGLEKLFSVNVSTVPMESLENLSSVTPAKAGVQSNWIPASAGMTSSAPLLPLEAQLASRLLYAYLTKIYRGKPPKLSIPKLVDMRHALILDSPTVRNLELFRNLASGEREGSLLHILDETKTSMGARCLRQWLLRPLLDRGEIERRHNAVSELLERGRIREEVRKRLSGFGDLERLTARVTFRTANARDLSAIRFILSELPELTRLVKSFHSTIMAKWIEKMPDLSELSDLLARALNENPPVSLKEGGLIRDGYHPELDRQKRELEDSLSWIARLEDNERKATGIKTLKVGFNQVFGYYLEVTRSHLAHVPAHYIRKQTLSNAERYVIEALKIQESKILGSQEKSKNLEHEIFCGVREEVCKKDEELKTCAALLAQLDALASLALVAEERHFSRPKMNDGEILSIKEGRHPVVEASTLSAFVPNDCFMDSTDNRLIVLTGPNMAGKSTYLRQVALIVILAQTGSFVPAESAELGIVDRVFTRIGASDDLHRGESTFFVEMKETAEILKHATKKSLVLLDEIGRGTSTFDGLSLAWATAEELLFKEAKVLFATHYHEMTALAGEAQGVRNYTVQVTEQDNEVIFLRRIIPGGADKSYGIHVAELAGIPPRVVERAKNVLRELEAREIGGTLATERALIEELGTGPSISKTCLGPATNGLEELGSERDWEYKKALGAVEVDRLTGLEALNLLASWKERFLAP